MAEPLRRGPWTAPAESSPALIGVFGVVLEAFAEGALWWEDERLLVVADLHLEKGSSFARRGQILPPYDTVETLRRLSQLIARLDPKWSSPGDSHDDDGAARLSASDRATLAAFRRPRMGLDRQSRPRQPTGLGAYSRRACDRQAHVPPRAVAAMRRQSSGHLHRRGSSVAVGPPPLLRRRRLPADPAGLRRLRRWPDVLDVPSPVCSPATRSRLVLGDDVSIRSVRGRCVGLVAPEDDAAEPPMTAQAPQSAVGQGQVRAKPPSSLEAG
jgi:hypothetical protein